MEESKGRAPVGAWEGRNTTMRLLICCAVTVLVLWASVFAMKVVFSMRKDLMDDAGSRGWYLFEFIGMIVMTAAGLFAALALTWVTYYPEVFRARMQ